MNLEPFTLFIKSLQLNGDLGYTSQSSTGSLNYLWNLLIQDPPIKVLPLSCALSPKLWLRQELL